MKIHKKDFLNIVKKSIKENSKDWILSSYYEEIKFNNFEIDVSLIVHPYFIAVLLDDDALEIRIKSSGVKLEFSYIQRIHIYILLRLYLFKKIKESILKRKEKENMIDVNVSKSYIRSIRLKKLE